MIKLQINVLLCKNNRKSKIINEHLKGYGKIMGKINVVIVDTTGNKEQKVGLPDDIKIGIIMVKLVEKIKLPSTGPDGNPISYKFIHKVSGRQLLETQTLSDAQIKDGDVLRLQPEITAGA
jgi:uncharacterized ubiquitin-like protein YukD